MSEEQMTLENQTAQETTQPENNQETSQPEVPEDITFLGGETETAQTEIPETTEEQKAEVQETQAETQAEEQPPTEQTPTTPEFDYRKGYEDTMRLLQQSLAMRQPQTQETATPEKDDGLSYKYSELQERLLNDPTGSAFAEAMLFEDGKYGLHVLHEYITGIGNRVLDKVMEVAKEFETFRNNYAQQSMQERQKQQYINSVRQSLKEDYNIADMRVTEEEVINAINSLQQRGLQPLPYRVAKLLADQKQQTVNQPQVQTQSQTTVAPTHIDHPGNTGKPAKEVKFTKEELEKLAEWGMKPEDIIPYMQ